MLVLISSLRLSIVPYALVQKIEVTRGQHLPIYRCRAASQVSLFVGFLISWISLPTKTTKIGTSRIKVISQYLKFFINLQVILGKFCICICFVCLILLTVFNIDTFSFTQYVCIYKKCAYYQYFYFILFSTKLQVVVIRLFL